MRINDPMRRGMVVVIGIVIPRSLGVDHVIMRRRRSKARRRRRGPIKNLNQDHELH